MDDDVRLGRHSDPARGAPSLAGRDFLLVIGATFSFFVAVSAFVLMPRQLWELEASDRVIGWVMGVWQLTTAVTMPLVGLSLHRVSPRRFMVLGALLLGLGCVLLSGIHHIGPALYAIRALQGIAFAVFFVSAGTVVVSVVPESRRAQGLALWGAGVLVTQAVAPLGGEALLRVGTFSHLYLAAAGACAGAALASFFLAPVERVPEAPTTMLSLLRRPALAMGLVALFAGSLGFGTIYAFLSAFAKEEGIGDVAPFFAAYTLGSLAVRFVAGRLADRYDRRLVIAPASVMGAAAIAHLAFSRTAVDLALSGLFYGIGSGLSYPALMAWVVDQAGPADRARAVALDNWAYTLGMLTAAVLFGVASEAVGMRMAFVAVAAMGATAALALVSVRLPPSRKHP